MYFLISTILSSRNSISAQEEAACQCGYWEITQSDMEKIIFYFIHFILTINLCANMGKDDLTGWA